MNNKIKRKVFALFLSLTMVVTMTPTMTMTAFAGQEVPGGEIEDTGGYGEMPHTHSFTYTAKNNVITATCTPRCEYAIKPLKLTLVAPTPEQLIYSGNAVTVNYRAGEVAAWKEAIGTDAPAIQYYLADGTIKTTNANSGANGTGTAPINAGAYLATSTAGTATAKLAFTITKAEQPAPEDEEGYEIDEDGTIKVKDGYVITTVAGLIAAGASLTGGVTYFIKKIGDKNHETSGGTTIVVDEDHNVEYETDPQPTDEGGGTTTDTPGDAEGSGTTTDPEEKTDTSAAQKALVNKTAIKLNTLTAYKDGKIKLSFNRTTWDKSNGKKVKTYQIYRSTKKNSGFKSVATITNSKTSKTVTYTNSKSLKKGKRYYYKVRGRIKLSNGKYAYTKWSNVKSIKCKKTR